MMLSFLKTIINPGDLVFDIGANIGQKLDIYLSLNARVVAVEPQSNCFTILKSKYQGCSNVVLVKKAVGDKTGKTEMYVCDDANVLSTLSRTWQKGRFSNYNFNRKISVEVTTSDKLIEHFGLPKFCKIDVEGFEYQVLSGLSYQIPYLSFEFAREFFQDTHNCIKLLVEKGYKYFNIVKGESCNFVFHDWVSPQEIVRFIRDSEDEMLWGDIYAKHIQSSKHSQNTFHSQNMSSNFKDNGEILVISHFIKSGDVVFDVGANVGKWTEKLLEIKSKIKVHAFEPAPKTYHNLLQALADSIKCRCVFPNNIALSSQEGIESFSHYESSPALSGFYRRNDKVEAQYNLADPKRFPVHTSTVDGYCQLLDINRVHFLKIDCEGGELNVLEGSRELLSKGKIDYVQFKYGGTYLDSKRTLKEAFALLSQYRYGIFKIHPQGLEYCGKFDNKYENYQYSNFLAVNERFLSKVLGQPSEMLNIQELCQKYSISPTGVIHIGAHEGQEVREYKESMGIEKLILIEANPDVFRRLNENVGHISGVQAVNCAITDENGIATLHVTSLDQSSSILPLKNHSSIYPSIKETRKITVQAKTLDTLLSDIQVSPRDYNLLNIDIQGAELKALRGASNLLKYVDAINTEVNYDELYEGCALIDEIDEFLEEHGFERVATTTPYHPSWGDAFYIKKPVITMSSLGSNGRFGNQLFQYAFLKIYAERHNLRLETPRWIGQYLFGHDDPPIAKQLPELRETTNDLHEAIVPNSETILKNVDFWGYFQYNTKYYAPYKKMFRSLFQPVPEIDRKLNAAFESLKMRGKTIVGLHLRRSDYGYKHFFVAPAEWYKNWLDGFWGTLDSPVLYIASDELEEVVDDFTNYSPVTAKDLKVSLPPEIIFYIDFYMLTRFDFTAISNSSFSFAASLLNEGGKHFARPHLPSQKLIPFDPWNSEILFKDAKVEDFKGTSKQSQNAKKLMSSSYERIKDSPESSEGYKELSKLLELQGNIQAAKRAYIKAQELRWGTQND
jgi:FkbM family methyltransferase